MADCFDDPHDPPPRPPERPADNECCGSGCPLCVYDLYHEQLLEYQQALAHWRARHPQADG